MLSRGCFFYNYFVGIILTKVANFSCPLNLRIFFFLKDTFPSVVAKRVSSFPRLTLLPARNFVPRCRRIMFPLLANCPPKSLTPNLWP
jgi:hypothetical protein